MNSDHYLVPPHKVLGQSETEKVLRSLHVALNNLPKIFVDDPQAKKIGAKIGQVIEIDRGKNKYYRLVVPRQ
ncbi:MAG: DNA-directed RNA polymerase subunit RpoH/Rpb5 C-terminal domain-containing protein [Candidatus Micrarchaeia archaeon]